MLEDADLTDHQARGIVLKRLYDRRHDAPPFLELGTPDTGGRRTENICLQLKEFGLITWKPSNRSSGGIAKITAQGVDVVEGTAPAPISVTLISVAESSNVQIGNGHTLKPEG
jgi:hypothetical protein